MFLSRHIARHLSLYLPLLFPSCALQSPFGWGSFCSLSHSLCPPSHTRIFAFLLGWLRSKQKAEFHAQLYWVPLPHDLHPRRLVDDCGSRRVHECRVAPGQARGVRHGGGHARCQDAARPWERRLRRRYAQALAVKCIHPRWCSHLGPSIPNYSPFPGPIHPTSLLALLRPPFFYHLILGVALDLTLSQATLTDSITTYRINYHLYISPSFPPCPISSTYCLPGRMFPFSFSPPQIARFFVCLCLSLSLSVHQLCQLVIVRYCAYIADWIGLTGLYPPPHGIRNSTC